MSVEVNGCAWCGELERGHARRWHAEIRAFHTYQAPSDELRKHRLIGRRARRLGLSPATVRHHARMATLNRLSARTTVLADRYVRQLERAFTSKSCRARQPGQAGMSQASVSRPLPAVDPASADGVPSLAVPGPSSGFPVPLRAGPSSAREG
ncbi:MAG: hypothetical protein HOV79_00365 [Hamadaea sp.]|nr:hypothetical protein [Hamadaea sp.]